MPYSRLFYHFVWATYDRLPLITAANQDAIYRAISQKVVDLQGLVHALNGMPDHVHLVVTVPPRVALATLIGQVKGSSSHLAGRLSDTDGARPFAWQQEYGVLSISEVHLPIVVRYVLQQQQHHADNRLNRTLEHVGSAS
jgi:putative transposase